MANGYHVEDIERITEQMIEEEVLEDIEQIRTSGIAEINNIDDTLTSIANDKRDLIIAFSESTDDGIRKKLNDIDEETNVIYQNITLIADNTESLIEEDIRQMIAEGYEIKFINDGSGNVTVTIEKVI